MLLVPFDSAADSAPEPGTWTLSSADDLVSIWANAASLSDVLSGIQDMTPAGVRFGQVPDREVSIRLNSVSLDALLSQLDVSYFLTYTDDGDAGFTLEGAWVSFFDRVDRTSAASPLRPGASANGAKGDPIPYAARRVLEGLPPEGTGGAPPPVGVEYRAAMPVQIGLDGDVSEWPEGIPWDPIAFDMGFDPGEGPDDSSFEIAAVSDEENLYIGVKVKDDLEAAERVADMLGNPDDELELLMQPVGKDGAYGTPIAMTIKRHHVFMQDPNDPSGRRVSRKQYIRNSAGASAVIVTGQDGWTIELAMPFERMGLDLNRDEPTFNFDVRLVDRDVGDEVPHQLIWSRAQRMLAPGPLGGQPGQMRVMDLRPFTP